MRILYIAPEHVSGTLDLWAREHRRRGDYCRYVTFFKNDSHYKNDIFLDLPLHPGNKTFIQFRRALYKHIRGPQGENTDISQKPPFRFNESRLQTVFFASRDFVIRPWVYHAIRKYNLNSFDIIHLDLGSGFFRDAHIIRKWYLEGKKIVAFYHGSDMRNRGIFPRVDECVHLRLTSELDLTYVDDRLKYLFLPCETSRWQPAPRKKRKKLKIVHAARNIFKGSQEIIDIVKRLEKNYPVELVWITGVSHAEAMRLKMDCDIAIDQIADAGGWGYGMSSVEYLSLGIPTCTRMNEQYEQFIPDHPFVNATAETLETELIKLIEDEDYRLRKGEESREWVVKYHDIRSVGDQLYSYYSSMGWF